jgi:hypothetical protein
MQMNQATRNKILKYIYDRYTAQEVIQALIKEFPKSIQRQSVKLKSNKIVMPKLSYQDYINKLSLKDKERIEVYANLDRYYLIYKLLIDKWIKK